MRWEDSYTKQINTKLVRAYLQGFGLGDAIHDATELLRDYWDDAHLPYEQRDEARARVKELAAANRYLLREIAHHRAHSRSLHTYNGDQQQKQAYMACGHYPDAISNHFEGRTSCEFCCEKEPLKWFDNGHHRMPGT